MKGGVFYATSKKRQFSPENKEMVIGLTKDLFTGVIYELRGTGDFVPVASSTAETISIVSEATL